MANDEVVSVLMSVYMEPENYIKKAVESILKQTYSNIEFIIILDNPDNKKAIDYLRNVEKKDERIKFLINKDNMGLPKSLNKGLKIAKGKYIARMDADDISKKNRIEKELEYLKKNNLDLVSALCIKMDQNDNIIKEQRIEKISGNDIYRILRHSNCMAHPLWLGKKEIFDELKGYRNILSCEDYDFLLRAMKNDKKLGVVPEVLLKYRINSEGISLSNEYRQKLMSYYLAKNYKNDKSDMMSIDRFIKKHITLEKQKKYSEAKLIEISDKSLIENIRRIRRIIILPEMMYIYLRSLRECIIEIGHKKLFLEHKE